MPTTRPRYPVTETDDIAEALEAAARLWPEDQGRPVALLRRLIAAGYQQIAPEAAHARSERLAALERVSGSYPGVFGSGYLERLREEWPH